MNTLSVTKDKYSGYSYSNWQYDGMQGKSGAVFKERKQNLRGDGDRLLRDGEFNECAPRQKEKPDTVLINTAESVRDKNGFKTAPAPAPENRDKMLCASAKKNEYNFGQSPSSVSFGGLCSNKVFKKILEKSANNSALCSATAMLLACGILRPASIMASQNVELENRKIAATKSIASGIIGFALMFLVSKPIEYAVDKIDKAPEKYLKPETIKSLIGNNTAKQAKAYNFATRFFKISADMLTAIPKGSLTIILIPPLLKYMFKNQKNNNSPENNIPNNSIFTQKDTPDVFKPVIDNKEEYDNPRNYVFFRSNSLTFNKVAFKGNQQKQTVSFKGNIADKAIEKLAKGLGKIMDSKALQKLSNRFQNASIENHVMAISGTMVSSAYVVNTINSKKIPEDRKGPLIYNSTISWALSTAGGYSIDKLLNNKIKQFKAKYAEINKKDTELAKQLRGINILKSALIFGMMYRWITPWISTILAEKVWNKKLEKAEAKKQ